MKLITESTLFVLLLCCCCCCVTVNAGCWVECPESQIGLSEPECLLRDDGTSDTCIKSIYSSDLSTQSIFGYKYVSLSIDLSSTAQKLLIYNKIGNSLKVGAFRSHFEIKELQMYNGYAYIRPDLFSFLPNLRHFNAYQVKFRYFPHFSHSNPFLNTLGVNLASFTYPGSYHGILRKGRVSGLSQLKTLLLYPDQFLNTTDESFSGLTNLTALYLGRFHVPNPVATFSPLVNLNRLHYESSGLTDISFLKQTSSLYGLMSLFLENNRITAIQSDTFLKYSKLVEVYLGNNEISRIEKNGFKGLKLLKWLYLNSNNLEELSPTAFRGLGYLILINLKSNSMSRLSSRTFESLHWLRHLYLDASPLNCDCNLQWMSNTSFHVYNSRCSTPPQHSGKPATDPSIYVNCTQELSYQCFNRSNSCPTGSYCQDTLDSYTCVCEEENYYFIKPLNKCVNSNSINCLKNANY